MLASVYLRDTESEFTSRRRCNSEDLLGEKTMTAPSGISFSKPNRCDHHMCSRAVSVEEYLTQSKVKVARMLASVYLRDTESEFTGRRRCNSEDLLDEKTMMAPSGIASTQPNRCDHHIRNRTVSVKVYFTQSKIKVARMLASVSVRISVE
jgi:hypothetical protein